MVPADVRFCLLGPLLVQRGGNVVRVSPGKQRALLAALLLSANTVVPVDDLADVLWDSRLPPSALASLQTYVMRLRKSLGDHDHSLIAAQPGGYMISLGPGDLDVDVFGSSLAAARDAMRAGSYADAAARLRTALALWRGQPLAGVASETLAMRELPRLTEMRLQALEARIDADLHLGRQADVIIELRQLAAANPLRERLHAFLMLALYRDGQQAGALAAYQIARNVLIAELGTEPGPELRQLQRQILAADPALAAPNPGGVTIGPPAGTEYGQQPAAVVPRQLPGAPPHFTGRSAELAVLAGILDHKAGGTVVISAIAGTAGVGKTALAVHWAHQAAGRFPDGQLYVNLRGYDPGQPMTAAEALARFLRALGVPGHDMPPDEDELATRYRTLVAGKRMLVVLDNAATAKQVRPLLPGTSGCAVVVTSRGSLAGLVARDGAVRLDLDLLPSAEAVNLLRELVGDRVDADPGAAAALADQCSRLPLALRVAAELAARRPAGRLADLAGELADQQRRLDLLDAGGDPSSAVRAVFSWSFRHLDTGTARAFRLLGLHPGPDFDSYAAGALTGTGAGESRRLLGRLARAYLIQPAGQGRYGMHDLLRAYAGELTAEEGENDRRAALTRLFDHYLHTAAAAMDSLFPAERHRRPRLSPPVSSAPPVTDPALAQEWLDRERAVLIAVARHAAEYGWPGHATRMALTLFRYLDTGDHYQDVVTVCSSALDAARLAGDRASEASALLYLGGASWRLGRYDDAAEHLREALALFRAVDDLPGQARALSNIGVVESCHGRHEAAAGYHRQARAIFCAAGDLLGQARALDSLGGVLSQEGDHNQAAEHQGAALEIYRQLGERHGEGGVLLSLGVVEWQRGRYQEATGHLRQALTVFREVGDRLGQARALGNIGVVEWSQGRYEQAAERHREAAAVFHEISDQAGEAGALNAYGEALQAAGRPRQARSAHQNALALAARIGDRHQQARARDGLGYTTPTAGSVRQG
jgi:DNA-binding SARP family transcriptional activator